MTMLGESITLTQDLKPGMQTLHYKTFAIEAWTKDIQALIIALYCCLIDVVNT